MSFWEMIGAVPNALGRLIEWPRAAWERKGKNRSQHIRVLLTCTENVSAIAEATYRVVTSEPGSARDRSRASELWGPAPTQLLLKNWSAYAWVLDRPKRNRALRNPFLDSVGQLRETAKAWHEADLKWRDSIGITEKDWLLHAERYASTPEGVAKTEAVQSYSRAYEEFLSVHQDINNALRPLLRD